MKTKRHHPWKRDVIGNSHGGSDARKKALAEVKRRAKMFKPK